MHSVLAIETSAACCSVAVSTLQGQVFSRVLEGEKVHHEALLPMIDAVLNESGLHGRDLAGVVVSVGPGSFTGVRIGVSVAQAFAFANDLTILPLSSLWIWAQTALAYLPVEQSNITVVVEARLHLAYCNQYDVKQVNDQRIALPRGQDHLCAVSDFLNQVKQPTWAAGSAIKAEIIEDFPLIQGINGKPLASVMPMLLPITLEQGVTWLAPEEAQPVYLEDDHLFQKSR